MSKKRILFGILVAMLVAVCSAFIGELPSVFASETLVTQASGNTWVTEENEAGTFTGQGFYVKGERAVLTATMNPGYKFEGWVDGDGNVLSTERAYSFDVVNNITITAKWSKIIYTVDFVDQEDFTYQILNETDEDGELYYNTALKITATINNAVNDLYVYDLIQDNIYITDSTGTHNLSTIVKGENPMGLQVVEINNNREDGAENKIGFNYFEITLNIRDFITIDIDYNKMYELDIVSADEAKVAIADLNSLIKVNETSYYSKLADYTYLAYPTEQISLSLNSNEVYTLNTSTLNDESVPSTEKNRSFEVAEHSVLKVDYNRNAYKAKFVSYLKNANGLYDAMTTPIYNIADVALTYLDTVTFKYDETTKAFTVNTTEYAFDNVSHGYKFVGFVINNENKGIENSYQLTDTDSQTEGVQLQDQEIQLLFEYIVYDFEIKFVDNFFADGVDCGYSYANDAKNLVTGTEITVSATSSQYTIVGWSNVANPSESDYITNGEGDKYIDSYTFTFNPISDDNTTPYSIYLGVDYSYIEVEYSLRDNSIEKNEAIVYDEVVLDRANSTITFTNSENAQDVQIITYTSDNMTEETTEGVTTTTIETDNATIGNIVINNSGLTYGEVGVYYSVSLTEGDVTTYAFDKYNYFGDLILSVVESIGVVEDELDTDDSDGKNVTITITGDNHTYGTKQTNQTLLIISAVMVLDDTIGAYKISYTPDGSNTVLDINLYKKDSAYSYIIAQGVRFNYDDANARFVVPTADSVKPSEVECVATKGNTYSIVLNNVLPSTLIMASTKTTNTATYQFNRFVDETNSGLSRYMNFTNGDYIARLLNTNNQQGIKAEYIKLQNAITLVISNENAYSYDNISISVAGVVSENPIQAINGQQIVISIFADKIVNGYKFDGFTFNEAGSFDSIDNTATINDAVLTITMNSNYINQSIYIWFSEIEYTLNINYIDKNGNIITPEAGNMLTITDSNGNTPSTINIAGEYTFTATAQEGYYVYKAYIGAEAYDINDLVRSNSSNDLTTNWTLSGAETFVTAIYNNANDDNIVNLYICFRIHTYSTKIYVTLEGDNADEVVPHTIITVSVGGNSIEVEPINTEVGADGSNKYFVYLDSFTYDVTINCEITKLRQGITIKEWVNSDGTMGAITKYSINNIKANHESTIVLTFIDYTVAFEYLNDLGQEDDNRGTAKATQRFKLFNTINYIVTPNHGYVASREYYLNANDIEQNITSASVRFDPANFKLSGTTFTIFVVFVEDEVTVTIQNVGGVPYGLVSSDVSDWATYTITRQGKDGTKELLDPDAEYLFKTNETLIMELTTISNGIMLNNVTLGDLIVSNGDNKTDYSFTIKNKYDNENNFVGIYYVITIKFTPERIAKLDSKATLNNTLQLRTYTVTYIYNLSAYKFGIKMYMQNQTTGAIKQGSADVKLTQTVSFASVIKYTYSAQNVDTDKMQNFDVNGFTINNIKVDAEKANGKATPLYNLNSLELWEQIALGMLQKAPNASIDVVMLLSPKISLYNWYDQSEAEGYKYTNEYIGEGQGLTSGEVGSTADIRLGADFDVIVKYNINGTFDTTQPINVGVYEVQIFAQVSAEDVGSIVVQFDKRVTYEITPKALNLKRISTVISKVYDGQYGLDSSVMRQYIQLDGVYTRDKANVLISENLSANFSGSAVNKDTELYSISVTGLQLINSAGNPVTNYTISSGDKFNFVNIGKITPKPLTITGFIVSSKKVYDGTDSVDVNLDGIKYVGKLDSDSTKILTENLRFYLEDYSIGTHRKVTVDWTNALVGADSTNYSVTFDEAFLDIHPYELEYTLDGYGTFKVVDIDKLALIPIEAQMIAKAYDSGSAEYRQMYGLIETEMRKGEKQKACYEVVLRIGYVNQPIPAGLYIYLPKTNKVAKVFQSTGTDEVERVNHTSHDNNLVVKTQSGKALFGVVVTASYMPLWLIILIIALVLLLIAIIVLVFIIIRRKTKRKYKAYDRI